VLEFAWNDLDELRALFAARYGVALLPPGQPAMPVAVAD
jgi:hypothetical protein